jgi:hypothetical protein
LNAGSQRNGQIFGGHARDVVMHPT